MSYWLRMSFVAGFLGVSSFTLAQTRNGPAVVRIGEVGERPTSNVQRSTSKEGKDEISASDKPGPDAPGDVTIVQMRTMFLELEHPDGKARERARERLMGLKRDDLKMLARVVAEFS